MVVNYVTLFDYTPALSLRYHPGDQQMPWHIQDRERDQLYARASTLPQAERFLRASEKKGDATVDWPSVRRMRQIEGALRLSYALMQGSGGGELAAPDATPPDTFSVRVPDNVVPIHEGAEA